MRFWYLVPPVFVMTSVAFGQDAVSLADANAAAHPAVVIVGARPVVGDVSAETQTSFVKVIPQEILESHIGSVADVLDGETGVQLRQRGGLGSPSSVSLRGSSEQQVNVYLDGLLLNSAAGGGVDLSRFLLGNLSSVEIYPDVTPAEVGFPNIGGAINLHTLKKSDTTRVFAGTGSFGATNAGVVSGRHEGADDMLAAIEYMGARNDFSYINNNQTPFNATDDFSDHRHNAGFHQTNVLFKDDHALADGRGLQGMLVFNDQSQQMPDISNSADNKALLDTRALHVQGRYFQPFLDGRSWALRPYISSVAETWDDQQQMIGLGAIHSRSTSSSVGVNPSVAWLSAAHVYTVSVDVRHEDYAQDNLLRDDLSPSWQRSRVDTVLQDQWQNDDHSLLVVPSLGVVWFEDDGNVIENGINNRFTRNTGDATAHLGARKLLAQEWSIKANISRNVRVPSLYELMGDRGYFVGNADLKPETSIAGDVGAEYTSSHVDAEVTGFYRWLDDAILPLYDSRGIGRFDNVSRAEIYGVELKLSKKLPAGLGVDVKTTLQDGIDDSPLADRNGKQLAGIYRYAGSATLTHDYRLVRNQLGYQWEGGGYYAPGEVAPMDDKRVLNYSMIFCVNASSVIFEANNLTDQHYQDYHRFPAPGRNYFIKFSQDF